MISENAMQGYLDEILAIEERMGQFYARIAGQLRHPEFKDFFLGMAKAERTHAERVRELQDKLSGNSTPDRTK